MDGVDLQAESVDDLLRQGIAAVKAGQRERAHELLMQVVEQDERNAQAWMWLSGVVDSLEDREVCLENVLAIDPGNAHARKGLDWVRQQLQQQAEPQPPSPPSGVSPFTVHPDDLPAEPASSDDVAPEPPVVERTRTPVSPAAAVLRDDFASSQSLVESTPVSPTIAPESPLEQRIQTPATPAAAMLREDFERSRPLPQPLPEPPPIKVDDVFDDEYLCPYCAAPTEPEDKKCKACGGGLWTKRRKQEKRSSLLWVLLGIQTGNTMFLALVPIILIYFLSATLPWIYFAETGTMVQAETMDFVYAYVGLPHSLPPEMVDAAFHMFPPFLFWLLTLPCMLSAVVTFGLLSRWKPVYYLLMVDAGLEVITSIVALAVVGEEVTGIIGFIFALARMALIFQLGGDFEWSQRRILLRTETGLKSSADFLIRSDFYAKQRMWAMAVVHLRSAISMLPDRLDCRLTLATLYVRLRRYDLVESELAEARRISPDDPRVGHLAALLDELQAGGTPQPSEA